MLYLDEVSQEVELNPNASVQTRIDCNNRL